jgi:hypothetical protein
MSVRNAIALFLAVFILGLLVGCGSSSPAPVAPPSGGFGVSNLSGTYVFSSTGSDSSGGFLTMTGSLTANGSGGITGGTVDLLGADIGLTNPIAQPITGGGYSVSADGRGQIHFNTTTINTTNGSTEAITFTLDFVLISSSHGLVTEFDGNGTGSGTIDLQSAVTQSQIASAYAYGVSGAGNGGFPLALVGAMTLDSTGSVTTGIEDINNDGIAATGAGGIALSPSSYVTLGATPGTALIASSSGTFSFDVYPVDNTHLKFVENDGINLLSGDMYTQGTSIASGQLVYTMAGSETNTGGTAPIDVGGWLTNTGGTITTGEEDYNDAGSVGLGLTVSGGAFATLAGGRSTLTLNSFVNGAANDLPGTSTFAAYPFAYSGGTGIQLLEIDNAGVTSGAAYPQTSTSLATPPQGYGFNLSGFNPNGEEDDIAEFVTTTTSFSGIVDLNNETALASGRSLDGSFTAPDGNGVGSGTTTNYIAGFNFYVVNPTTYLVLETDDGQVAIGTFEQQGSPSAGAAQGPVSLFRPVARAHTALKGRQ